MWTKDIIELENFMEQYQRKIVAMRESLSLDQLPKLTEELFSIYEKTGSRLEYEAVYFTKRKYLAVYGLLALIQSYEEKVEDSLIKELEYILRDICNEEYWGLPAHVDRENNEHWRLTIDLFAAETASALAEIITYLKEYLSTEIIELVACEVERRVLTPFYSSQFPYSQWEVAEHNWSSVCGGSIGVASIHILKERFDPSKINRINNCLSHYIDGFLGDGVCMEGLLYFTYGMTFYVSYGEALKEHTHGDIDLLCDNKVTKIAKFQESCYFGGGRTISFSDGNSSENYRFGLTCKLALRYPEISIPSIKQAASFDFDPCYRFLGLHRDYLWGMEYIKDRKQKAMDMADILDAKHNVDQEKGQDVQTIKEKAYDIKQSTFSQSQWSIVEVGELVGYGIKGGHNDEPHNHNDVGSFLYVVGDTMLLTDLGAGEYTKDYFREGRYEILCNRSLGHNVPIINQKEQGTGSNYHSDLFACDGKGGTKVSFHSAYEEGALDGLVRRIYVEEGTNELRLEDRFVVNKDTTSIIENFVTQYEPKIYENKIEIRSATYGCMLEIITPFLSIDVLEESHSNHDGILEKVYRIEVALEIEKNQRITKGFEERELFYRMNLRPITHSTVGN